MTQTRVIQMPCVPRLQELTPDLHAHAFHLLLEMVLFAEVSLPYSLTLILCHHPGMHKTIYSDVLVGLSTGEGWGDFSYNILTALW